MANVTPSTESPPRRRPPGRGHSFYLHRRFGGPLYLLFGTPTRFILALLLIAACAKWRYDNRDAVVIELEQMNGHRIDPTLQDPTKAIDTRLNTERREHIEQIAQIPLVPESIRAGVSSWNSGVAGLLLILSLFSSAFTTAIAVTAAAAILVFGDHIEFIANLPLGSPRIAALIVGGALGITGLVLGRKLG